MLSFLKQEPISKILTGPSVWSLSLLMTTYRLGASMGLRHLLSSMKNTCLYSGWSGVMVIFARAFVEMIVGVLTSMNPLATSLSAMSAFSLSRSCLRGFAMMSSTPASFAALVLDMILANCLSRSVASSNSASAKSASPYSIRRWICGSVNLSTIISP